MGRKNLDIETEPTTTDTRYEKVKRIFQLFDTNHDGCLNRDEMAALLMAVNPGVKFIKAQIEAINDEVYLTYAEFIDGDKGITLDGLKRTYDDVDGDVDRDFNTLGLDLNTPVPTTAASSMITEPSLKNRAGEQAVLPNHPIAFPSTFEVLDHLDFLVQKLRKPEQPKEGKTKKNRTNSDQNYAVFAKELVDLRTRADEDCTMEEAFDRHMAMGRGLYEYRLYDEALISFRRSLEHQPSNVVPRFRAGNCLYELGRYGEAKQEFLLALADAKDVGVRNWEYLLPQIHVNIGIVLETEGMVLNACDHYREAVILCPTYFRALKHLGSALIAVGEYRAGVVALEEAIFLKRDYVDAYYEFGLALIDTGDKEKAVLEFQKVLDLKPGHVDALYNLGELAMDMGRYRIALEMYTRVLDVSPNHWKALLSKAVLFFGSDNSVEAKKALKVGLKVADRFEMHDRLAYLKQLQKRRLKGNRGGIGGFGEEACIIVEPSKFKTVEESTTLRLELANALDIRTFQKITGLNQCDVELLKMQMDEYPLPFSYFGRSFAERSIRKASLEWVLRELLSFLKPETFVGVVKLINKEILSVLDETKSGEVDLGLFLAVVAPLFRGPPDRRKRVAYHALLSRFGNEGSTKIMKTDAQRYIKLLRAIYIPSVGVSDMLEVHEEMDTSMISFTEFLALFDDPDWGFGIMSTLLKLELGERNGSYVCASCRFAIIGPCYKEMRSHFSLCSLCYSQGRVPSTCKQEEYLFKEYAN